MFFAFYFCFLNPVNIVIGILYRTDIEKLRIKKIKNIYQQNVDKKDDDSALLILVFTYL